MIRCRLAPLPLSLVVATGCLTPQMGQTIRDRLDLGPGPSSRRPGTVGRPRTAFDRDAGLPARIWLFDPGARIYHERRTNTFVLWDDSHKGWIAVSRAAAFGDEFSAARAHLLVEGAPPAVERCLDYIVDMEPDWRGT